jgi:hypothetical protein
MAVALQPIYSTLLIIILFEELNQALKQGNKAAHALRTRHHGVCGIQIV